MKIRINEFSIDAAEPVEAPLDFTTLCALLAQHQAETPTARLARRGNDGIEQPDHSNPAVAVLLSGAGQPVSSNGAQGSFHAAAAAHFSDKPRKYDDLPVYRTAQSFLESPSPTSDIGERVRVARPCLR